MARFWSAKQVAEFLGCSVRKVRSDDARGLLPKAIRLGRLKRWDAEELGRWAEAGCPPRFKWEQSKVVNISKNKKQ